MQAAVNMQAAQTYVLRPLHAAVVMSMVGHDESQCRAMERIGPKKPPRLFIREWMETRHINQRRLAERLDCPEATVSRLLSGKIQLTLNWLAAFAYALNVEVVDLYRDPAQPSPAELLRKLPADKQKQAIEFIEFLATGTSDK